MPTRVELDADDETLAAELVKSGRYASIEEVIREGVELLRLQEARRADFHAALDQGLASIQAGKVRPAEDVFDELIAKYDAMANQAAE